MIIATQQMKTTTLKLIPQQTMPVTQQLFQVTPMMKKNYLL